MSDSTNGEVVGEVEFHGEEDKFDSITLCLVEDGRKIVANDINIDKKGSYKLIRSTDNND